MILSFPQVLRWAVFAILWATVFGRAAAEETEFVPMPVEWRQEGPAPEASDESLRPVLKVKVAGREEPYTLPMAVDTALLNKDARPQQTAGDLQVRDNRYHQALFRPDLSSLPPQARIEDATFQFRVGWREKAASARLTFHQILADWSPEATWFKASPESKEWNGMKSGEDFADEAFAQLDLDAVEPGVYSVGGFGPLIQSWLDGTPNHGFSLQLRGAARQINVRSSEAQPKKIARKSLVLGGAKNQRIVLTVDAALLRRLILEVDDVHGVRLELFPGKNPVPDLSGVAVTGAQPLKVSHSDGAVILSGLRAELRNLLESGEATREFSLTLAPGELIVGGPDAGKESRPRFLVELRDRPSEQLFEHQVRIQPGVYVTAQDGHLRYGDQRLRIWGALGYGKVERMRKMGFNGWRLWPTAGKAYSEESIRTGDFAPSSQGDGSELDKIDRSFAEFKRNGFFLMATQLMGLPSVSLLVRDDSFVAGGEDWQEWKEAVKSMAKGQDAAGPASVRRLAFIDERISRARIRHAKNFLNHLNPYTGKKYAEDEAVAIWELDNELRFVPHVLDGGVDQWAPYFQRKFVAQWNDWLRRKYGSEAALRKAWGQWGPKEKWGEFLPAPTTKQAAQFPAARAEDFVRFTIELADRFYQQLRTECRAQAPSGIGVAVAPFSFDTQYKPSIPWLYQQSRSDVANFGMYFWGLGSSLTTPPSAYVMDSHTVEGRPTIIYETNQGRPSPYRAEFPYKLAALASWQDWDAIFFHYWGAWDMETDEEFLVQSLKHVDVNHFWNGVHHHNDPVMTSAMAAAGRMFLNGSISPAPKPAIYRLGSEGIFGFGRANGVPAGRDTFSRGSRIRFEPDQNFELKVENGGPDTPLSGPVQAGDQITWDWPRGRLIVDAPAARVFVGPVTEEPWQFRDGLTLSGLSSPWVAFGMTDADGKSLAQSRRLYISAVSDAVNTGFAFDWSVSGGPVDQAKAIKSTGRAPMLVDQVDYTLSFPQTMNWEFQGYDFALRRIVESSAHSSVLRVRNGGKDCPGGVSNSHNQEIWMGDLKISSRDGSATQVVDANPGAAIQAADIGLESTDTTDAKFAGIWNPLPGVSWGDGYARVHRALRDAAVRFTSLTPENRKPGGDDLIVWSDAEVLFGLPAAFDIHFSGKRLRKISATFVQPPNFRDTVAAYEKQLGTPLEKTVTDNQFEQSSVKWLIKSGDSTMEVLLTEAQGVVRISWSLK